MANFNKEKFIKVMKTPVLYNNTSVSIPHVTKSQTDFNNYEDESDDSASLGSSLTVSEYETLNKEKDTKSLNSVSFEDQIKIDFIPSIDYRILCRFLGVTTVNSIQNHPYQSHPLITLILMESIIGFMKNEGFECVGELNFDSNGNSVPPVKNPWFVKNKETTFTITGFLYFEKIGGKKTDNIAFFLYTDLERGGSSITSYSTDKNLSKNVINDLQEYAKKNNCLRGAKLKDINMISASFSEVNIDKKYNWDNYYYSKEIKDLFQLEVFDFIKNVKEYNKCDINKRGIIIAGPPGTGKSTLGYIICNMVSDNTVIWITPEILSENNYKAISSVKALYKLADFLSPCIVILEDLDLFSQDRERGGDILSLGALMNILDGINTISNSVTIGTTNRLKSIEGALRNRPGRFDRVVEIPALSDTLREKMFKQRLSGWKVSKDVIEYIVNKTSKWTGAEVQEFINSLNLKQISSKRKIKKIDQQWAEEIITTMSNFGVGKVSSSFGFSSREKD